MTEVPWGVLAPLIGVVVVADALLLLDLRSRQVIALPKWAWAVIIVVVTFPLGGLLYWFAGRMPPDQERSVEAAPPADDRVGERVHDVRVGDSDRPWEPAGPVVLATHGLRKVYEVAAVDGVDLRVPEGSIYGLIGPNGAGKTTLLDVVADLRTPTAGRVEVHVDRRRMAVLPDTPDFERWLTAREVVDLARHLVDPGAPADSVDAALAEVDLLPAADRRTGGFSRGMLQRLGLATCLVGDPVVLVLDEPSSALDPAGRREVLDLIGRLSGTRTVILSTHVLSDVQQVCDTVGVLQAGRLVFQGPIEDLLSRTSSVYRLRVGSPNDVGAALRGVSWVEEVIPESSGGYRIVVSDVAAAEGGIAAVLAAADVRLHAFGPATDLEAAFLDLTEVRS